MSQQDGSRAALRRLSRWAGKAVGNAVEIAQLGRLGADRHAVYDVVDKTAHYRLRHYLPSENAVGRASAPVLLVPPLMLTAEIYDVAPELSAVDLLRQRGIDVWVVDFGAPEREAGGMDRTLDDHVRSVVRAVRRINDLSGQRVHVAGYSQGGMFAYQAAAWLRSEGISSLITFGSPVDIHRTVPGVFSDITSRLLQGVKPLVDVPLKQVNGLPGKLTSIGFKLLTPRKEIQQLLRLLGQLHDRQALEKQQTRRRFLGGEGFVAWPGPALEQFFDQFIVHNRLLAGGIVIDGRAVSLADIECPILYFMGNRDDFARPASVRAIARAAPRAQAYESMVRAGHFGLVVGSTALRHTWPSVVDWVHWRAGDGPLPAAIAAATPGKRAGARERDEAADGELPWQSLGDEIVNHARERWRRLGHVVRDAGDTVHNLRWQLPRLSQLASMTGDSRISASLVLAQQSRSIGDKPFFLYLGRAFSYAEANTRVDHVVRGLIACGLRRGDYVGVWMGGRPSLLSLVTALSRLGAVAVLLDPRLAGEALVAALRIEPLNVAIADPERARALKAAFAGEVLMLGGGRERPIQPASADLEVVDMEAIDSDRVTLPADFEADPGLARDPAMVFIRGVERDALKVSRISHGRWAFSAIGVASAATLSPADTVYCGWGLPLTHPTSMMVAMGGALVGGARLALPHGELGSFSANEFWQQVRRYGATVVFYAGEVPRMLLTAPPTASDRDHPVRLLAGSGMRANLWRDLEERFGFSVMEFYASTERNLVLANASGKKRGALGQPLPASSELALARYDFNADAFTSTSHTGHNGQWLRCSDDETGVALVRANPRAPAGDARRNVFETGDAWFVSGDVLRRDPDGDYWFVDRLRNMVRAEGGLLATPPIEDALYQLRGVSLAVAYGQPLPGSRYEVPVAAVIANTALSAARLDEALATLSEAQRPRVVLRVTQLPMTDSQRPLKQLLANKPPSEVLQRWVIDQASGRYRDD